MIDNQNVWIICVALNRFLIDFRVANIGIVVCKRWRRIRNKFICCACIDFMVNAIGVIGILWKIKWVRGSGHWKSLIHAHMYGQTTTTTTKQKSEIEWQYETKTNGLITMCRFTWQRRAIWTQIVRNMIANEREQWKSLVLSTRLLHSNRFWLLYQSIDTLVYSRTLATTLANVCIIWIIGEVITEKTLTRSWFCCVCVRVGAMKMLIHAMHLRDSRFSDGFAVLLGRWFIYGWKLIEHGWRMEERGGSDEQRERSVGSSCDGWWTVTGTRSERGAVTMAMRYSGLLDNSISD